MKELIQAGNFYESLDDEDRKDLLYALAESIMFLDENLQRDVLILLGKISEDIAKEVARINNFTI